MCLSAQDITCILICPSVATCYNVPTHAAAYLETSASRAEPSLNSPPRQQTRYRPPFRHCQNTNVHSAQPVDPTALRGVLVHLLEKMLLTLLCHSLTPCFTIIVATKTQLYMSYCRHTAGGGSMLYVEGLVSSRGGGTAPQPRSRVSGNMLAPKAATPTVARLTGPFYKFYPLLVKTQKEGTASGTPLFPLSGGPKFNYSTCEGSGTTHVHAFKRGCLVGPAGGLTYFQGLFEGLRVE